VWNLKKCRLVCKYWYYEATPLLKKKSKISFKSEEEMEKCVLPNLDSLCQTFDIGVNINLYSSRTKSFFIRNKNTIKSLDLSFHHEYSSSWMIDVFSCLENIEELCLNGRATFLHEDTLAMCNLSVQLSKLKFLFIYDSSYDLDGSDARRIWKENIFQILQAAPNLERVFFAPFLESRAKTFFSLLTNEDLHHKGISHLHVNHFAASPLEIKILLNKNYPLKYVHLVLTCNLDRSDLNSFLHRLKLTLRELTLTFTDGTTCSQYHPIEPLDDVAKLSLIGYEGPFVISPAQKLQLFVMSLTEMPLNPWDIKISRGLKDLEIYDSKLKYFVENLRILYKSFICLRSLKMNNINNDILRTIFTHLKSLNELHICFHKFYGITSVYIDSGMNGIPEYKLEDFLLDCMDARDIDHFRSFPWIGAMKSNLTTYYFMFSTADC
jgi:hypothetical protein